MPATQQLHDLGQSLWIDNITRDMLKEGTLQQYIEELSLTGLTSNPTIFQKAIKSSKLYDDSILELRNQGREGEQLFFELALQDIQEAADLFRPVWERTAGVDGWVS
ncbi:MAG: transaldolase family protein, partial [Gimesia chilikensis]